MKIFNSLLATVLLLAFLFACEDPIDVPSPFEEPTIVVDAWLTNTPDTQTIVLSQSVDYFGDGVPTFVGDANVTVCRNDNEICFDFTPTRPGHYQWVPPAVDSTLGRVGDDFRLTIQSGDRTLRSETQLRRTARLDSISLTFEEEQLGRDEGFYAQLYARDQVGIGDTYWARVWKNDTLLNRTSETIIAYDGTFDSGTGTDGFYFLPPLRFINARDDDGFEVPYVAGDSIYAEVWSISNTAFQFLSIALEQIDNSGIFAVPIANARGNVSDESGANVLGIFNVAEVASISRVVE